MERYFYGEGSPAKVSSDMATEYKEMGMTESLAEACLDLAIERSSLLDREETAGKGEARLGGNGRGILIGEGDVFIGIKSNTACFLCFLLSNAVLKRIPLEEGVPSAVAGYAAGVCLQCSLDKILSWANANGKKFKLFDEGNGEKCLMREVRMADGAKTKSLIRTGKECLNNDLTCNYNHGGYCAKTAKEFKDMLEKLAAEGVLVTKEGKYYVET